MIEQSDLVRARGFDVEGAIDFCDSIAGKNYFRVRNARAMPGPRSIQLFGAAIASGLIIGVQAERIKK